VADCLSGSDDLANLPVFKVGHMPALAAVPAVMPEALEPALDLVAMRRQVAVRILHGIPVLPTVPVSGQPSGIHRPRRLPVGASPGGTRQEPELSILDASRDKRQSFARVHAEGEPITVMLAGEATETRVRGGVIGRAEHSTDARRRDEGLPFRVHAKRK